MVAIAAASAVGACVTSPARVTRERSGTNAAPERWNGQNDPASVDPTFVYDVNALPVTGTLTRAPIPSDYWPTYQDGIHRKWDGEPSQSPAEKWGAAFGRPATAETVSRLYGVRSHAPAPPCVASADCAPLRNGSDCAIAPGESTGRCIPTWMGICHGWAAYAIAEPPVTRPVVKNGVTFYAGDIEALMSLVYSENVPMKVLSERCMDDVPDVDHDGRLPGSACRDMNPGAFHVVATNMIGLRDQGFIYDRTYDDEVWNQPVRGFEVANRTPQGKIPEVTRAEAASLLGIDVDLTEAKALTSLVQGEEISGSYTAPAAGEVTIKTSGVGKVDLYVKKGAPATQASADCTSTGGAASKRCRIVASAGEELHFMVRGRTEAARAVVLAGMRRQGPPEYRFHPEAARFFYVLMFFSYVGEAYPARASHVGAVDYYTRLDEYEYILETDAGGKILGGEWVDDSQQLHPDFSWWPTGAPTGSVAEGLISYAEVKALNDEASTAEPPDAGADAAPAVVDASAPGVDASVAEAAAPADAAGGAETASTADASDAADATARTDAPIANDPPDASGVPVPDPTTDDASVATHGGVELTPPPAPADPTSSPPPAAPSAPPSATESGCSATPRSTPDMPLSAATFGIVALGALARRRLRS